MSGPRVVIFGPNPLLGVTIETRGAAGDDIHLHASGQGVWVARMAAEIGATPVLCGLVGGETGATVTGLLEGLEGERRLVAAAGDTGCYVMDRRSGERQVLAQAFSPPASRHEVDDLVSGTLGEALRGDALVVCNPFPADVLPLDVYEELVRDARANGIPVLVDLSSPRLERALAGGPDLVKLNDWELAEYVTGPVSEPGQLRAAAERLLEAGARSVVVTRGGEPALGLHDGRAWEITPPRFPTGHREGCGDTMMGALAAAWARGDEWLDSVRLGAAAGAANFLRHGLGSGEAVVVEELLERVSVREPDG